MEPAQSPNYLFGKQLVIPDDLELQLWSYLDPKQQAKSRRVSKHWKARDEQYLNLDFWNVFRRTVAQRPQITRNVDMLSTGSLDLCGNYCVYDAQRQLIRQHIKCPAVSHTLKENELISGRFLSNFSMLSEDQLQISSSNTIEILSPWTKCKEQTESETKENHSLLFETSDVMYLDYESTTETIMGVLSSDVSKLILQDQAKSRVLTLPSTIPPEALSLPASTKLEFELRTAQFHNQA